MSGPMKRSLCSTPKVLQPLARAPKTASPGGSAPIVVKASVDTVRLTIKASVSINLPIVGTKELVTVDGNLKDGVKGEIDALFAKGSVTFFLKNGLELWVKLEVSGPLCPKIDKEFKIFKLCESNDQ
ncbi:hypothetical protein OPQ81_002404 [Rhizoctonia solani]|nr:hypothetical protein OPQ81_002404 [Rhizoctonia solani]